MGIHNSAIMQSPTTTEVKIREWSKFRNFRHTKTTGNGDERVVFDNGEVVPLTASEFKVRAEALSALKEHQHDSGVKDCRMTHCNNRVARIYAAKTLCEEHLGCFVQDTKDPDFGEDGKSSRITSGYDVVIRIISPNIKPVRGELEAKKPVRNAHIGPFWIRIIKGKPTLYMSEGKTFLAAVDPRKCKMLVTKNSEYKGEKEGRRLVMVINHNIYFQHSEPLSGDFPGILIGKPVCMNKLLGYTCHSFETRNKPEGLVVPENEQHPYLWKLQNEKYPDPSKLLEKLTPPGVSGFLETSNSHRVIACDYCPRCKSVQDELKKVKVDRIMAKKEKSCEEAEDHVNTVVTVPVKEEVPKGLLEQTIGLLAKAENRAQEDAAELKKKDDELEKLRRQLASLRSQLVNSTE